MFDKTKRSSKSDNFVKMLHRREMGSITNTVFQNSNSHMKFRNFQFKAALEICNCHRSMIVQIVYARRIIFALTSCGTCAAFSREANKKLCLLNTTPGQTIRSIFYNKENNSLITVSLYPFDTSLKCRTTPIEYIKRGQPEAGYPLFQSESFYWPGYIVFDNFNGRILSFSPQNGIYKVFDLNNYALLFSITDTNIMDIQITKGMILLIFRKSPIEDHLDFRILSMINGNVLKSLRHVLHSQKKLDFIGQFQEKLFIKQENNNMQIIDVVDDRLIEVSDTDIMTTSPFIVLNDKQLFLTFHNRSVNVRNFQGELVASFDEHLIWQPYSNSSNICVTGDQNYIISFCKVDSSGVDRGNRSINICNVVSGKRFSMISSNDDNAPTIKSSVKEALENVTRLCYNEEYNEIYTGNTLGMVHIWSN
ncbi:hypothetical protein KI387_016338 [Taxus chinensis]|uniref:Uncharacterized protein n=1 Tax=Taxus chinensis TaxID=29808 RepID=A0AA38GEE8_TAXCH|nr:hypothetical protein KI387_016338 [Taxus chinensis]